MLHVEAATGADDERAAVTELARLMDNVAFDRYLYTDRVRIDRTARYSHSHPVLTLRPGHVLNGRNLALTSLVHEQMHWAWFVVLGITAAMDEARARWPNPPPGSAGGAADADSTWLHFPVCALELDVMSDLVGETDAHATVRAVPWYRWIYERLLDDLPYRDYLARHRIALPDVPPTRLAPLEALESSGLEDPGTNIDDMRRIIETHVDRWAAGADAAGLCHAISADVLAAWGDTGLPPALVARIVAVSVVTLAAVAARTGEADAAAAGARHPRNADVYAAIANRPDLLAPIAAIDDEAAALVQWARHG